VPYLKNRLQFPSSGWGRSRQHRLRSRQQRDVDRRPRGLAAGIGFHAEALRRCLSTTCLDDRPVPSTRNRHWPRAVAPGKNGSKTPVRGSGTGIPAVGRDTTNSAGVRWAFQLAEASPRRALPENGLHLPRCPSDSAGGAPPRGTGPRGFFFVFMSPVDLPGSHVDVENQCRCRCGARHAYSLQTTGD